MSRKKGLDAPEGNWIVSYADLMQFLLFLFIMMYAMQQAKQTANPIEASAASSETTSISSEAASDQGNTDSLPAQQVSAANGGGSVNAGGKPYYYVASSAANTTSETKTKTSQTQAASQADTQGTPTYQDAQSFISGNNLQRSVSVIQAETGIIFDIQAEILFDPGSSQIRPDSYPILNKISQYLGTLSNDVIIAGYTDNQPITTGTYQSNWELSCDRATKVLRYFTDSCSIDPSRFQAVGYGEYRPIADNSTESGRQENRRVEVIIVKAKA